MTAETAPKGRLLWAVLVVLIAFSGLCSIFALVVTAAQAWQERAQARWPQVTAHVDNCAMRQSSTRRREMYYIRCRLSYVVDDEAYVATIYSSSAPSRNVAQYPPNQIGPFEDWVNAHPPGTPIAVRYDPARHTKVILATDYMPRGGPQTPNNLKLLGAFAGSFLVLLIIATVTRPRSLAKADAAESLKQ